MRDDRTYQTEPYMPYNPASMSGVKTTNEDTCMMQAWYDEFEHECKENRGNCEQCPLRCYDDPADPD